ncbi:hypothetical protein [Acrocarpospora sp. B8E8]|uniref:hypothetical protein n=1 Tax=Acrocarpospora sp. B8E8 TaxID=3153572 RepID=UPI00325D93D9
MTPSDGHSATDNPTDDVPGEAQHYAGDHVEFHDNLFTGPVAGTIEYHDHQHHYSASDRTEQVWSGSPYRGLARRGCVLRP